jgi:hypothetical protein
VRTAVTRARRIFGAPSRGWSRVALPKPSRNLAATQLHLRLPHLVASCRKVHTHIWSQYRCQRCRQPRPRYMYRQGRCNRAWPQLLSRIDRQSSICKAKHTSTHKVQARCNQKSCSSAPIASQLPLKSSISSDWSMLRFTIARTGAAVTTNPGVCLREHIQEVVQVHHVPRCGRLRFVLSIPYQRQ